MNDAKLQAATAALDTAAGLVHDHFGLTDPARQSIQDRRDCKRILSEAREQIAPIRQRFTVGQPTGEAADVLEGYEKLCRSVLERLSEAAIVDDSNRRETSDLMI
jgi:hypothetical protein